MQDADRWPWLGALSGAIADRCRRGETVIATCSALKRAYRDCIRRLVEAPVEFVQLQADRKTLLLRMRLRAGHYMPPSLLESQLSTLEPPQPDESVLVLPAGARSEALVETVLRHFSSDSLRDVETNRPAAPDTAARKG